MRWAHATTVLHIGVHHEVETRYTRPSGVSRIGRGMGAGGAGSLKTSSTRVLSLIGIIVSLGGPAGRTTVAQCQQQKLHLDATDVNGEAAIDGDWAVVGAGRRPGVVNVYRLRDGRWVDDQVLSSEDMYGQFFGRSVAISGNVIVVGDSFAGPKASAGAAYVYRYADGKWTREAKLVPSDLDFDDTFGISVAVRGDVIVVGADRDDDAGDGSGSAYLFRFNGFFWARETKLVASDGEPGDGFGSSVAVDGDLVVVGAPRHDNLGIDSGAAYAFGYDGNTWIEEKKLTPSNGQAGDLFGYSVSASGDSLFVGAFRHHGVADETGAAYAFRFQQGSWFEEQTLTASDAEANDWFGVSVSLSGDRAVIGASLDNGQSGTYSGSVYVFEFNGFEWIEQNRITPSAAWGISHFGSSVALGGDQLLVGADDRLSHIPASAYAFDLEGGDCDDNRVCDDQDERGYLYQVSSFRFSPVGHGWTHEFILESPPEAASDVTLTLNATSDLDQPTEWIDVRLNETPVGRVFADTGSLCAHSHNHEELTVSADAYNALRTEQVVITLVASESVNPLACWNDSSLGVTVRYETIPAGDCNGNRVLDVCDLDMGTSNDADGNGIPDECFACSDNAECDDGDVCDFVQCVANVCRTRFAIYGDLVGVGETCGPDGLVDIHDIFAVFNAFQGEFAEGCSLINADLAAAGGRCVPDGIIDLADIFAVLDAFHGIDPCCTQAR